MARHDSSVFRFSDVEVHEGELHIRRNGEVLPVEPKAFRVLLHLLRNPGRLIPKDELIAAGWGDSAVTDNSLTRNIALLRRILGDDPHDPRYIETVSTVGYRFVCPVQPAQPALGTTDGLNRMSADRQYADAGIEPAEIHREVIQAEKDTRARRRARNLLKGAIAILAVGLAITWYLSGSIPTPHISRYSQITHEGHSKALGGTDGSRVYFTQLSPTVIAEVAVTGGDVATLPVAVPNLSSVEDLSPDGTAFLIASREEGNPSSVLWTVPVLGGPLHRLSEALSGAFSPDGKLVAYSTLGGDIYTVGSDGTGPRKLASAGGKAYRLAWSPDSRAIRFTKDGKLWEISPAGPEAHELLPGWGGSTLQCCGKWTPDGTLFLFLSGILALPNGVLAPAGDRQIWALDERKRPFHRSRSEPVPLTTGPIRWDAPTPGKDGMSIFAGGRTERGELVRFDAKTGQFRPFLGGISAEHVAFSNDGKSVAYVSFPEGALWKANSDGSHPVQLTEPPLHAELPQWSPDGTQILFIDVSSSFYEMYVVSSDGGQPKRLLPNSKRKQDAPSWSHDGRRIVFSRGLSTGLKEENLGMLDIASGQVSLIPGSIGMYAPRWSPDGKVIAAEAFNSHSLKILDMERQRWSEISTHGSMSGLAWSRDSHSVYFLLLTKDDQGIYRTPVDGGPTERTLELKDLHLAGYQGFSWSLDPTDAPILLRDIGSNDIYALTLDRR